MTQPINMSAITAASLQNFSLHHHDTSVFVAEGSGFENETSSESTTTEATLEQLNNSNASWPLPNHWEQCLDLKTREVYYINWKTGMKSKEHPRNGYLYSDDIEEEEEDDEDDESYSSSSAVSSSRKRNKNEKLEEVVSVLVVAGCKRCLMYLMVAKHVEECPKCNAQLLHFDRSLA